MEGGGQGQVFLKGAGWGQVLLDKTEHCCCHIFHALGVFHANSQIDTSLFTPMTCHNIQEMPKRKCT